MNLNRNITSWAFYVTQFVVYMIHFLLLTVALASPSRETLMEYFYYSSAAFCPPDVILDWSCDYPCRNTTGMV